MRNVKRYLYAVRDELSEIEELQARINEMRVALLPSAIRYDRDKVQTSPSDTVTDRMAAIAEYSNLLDRKISKLYRRRATAQRLIDTLTDSLERQVLSMYFLSNSRPTMDEIATRVSYSVQHTFRIYAAGLEHLQDKFKDESKRE